MDVPLLTDDFKEFLKSLNESGVSYLVVGGYAVGLHGYPRATIDLDIWVEPTAANAERVVAALRTFGVGASVPAADVFVNPRTLVRFGVPPFRIEIMTAIDGVTFGPCHARAVRFDVDGVAMPVISLDDLKINKQAAGRHKDLNDLENLP
jgi:predicted nucleotidyltransferase